MTRPYRRSLWRRAANGLVRPLARLGLTGRRTYLLTVPGRVSGRLWSTPVSIVADGDARWLVAPYGGRNWVKNARAAGAVDLRRGRERTRYRVEELDAVAAVPVLRRYYALGRVTRPFFDVSLGSPEEDWVAEAPRHPVFRLRANFEREMRVATHDCKGDRRAGPAESQAPSGTNASVATVDCALVASHPLA